MSLAKGNEEVVIGPRGKGEVEAGSTSLFYLYFGEFYGIHSKRKKSFVFVPLKVENGSIVPARIAKEETSGKIINVDLEYLGRKTSKTSSSFAVALEGLLLEENIKELVGDLPNKVYLVGGMRDFYSDDRLLWRVLCVSRDEAFDCSKLFLSRVEEMSSGKKSRKEDYPFRPVGYRIPGNGKVFASLRDEDVKRLKVLSNTKGGVSVSVLNL